MNTLKNLKNQKRDFFFLEIKQKSLVNDKELPSLKDEEIGALIRSLSFKEVKSGKSLRVENEIKGKSTILNLFISTCMGCPEGRRVALLKEIAKKIGSKGKVLILFGRGNGFDMIKEWAERMELDEPISIGVIEGNSLDHNYLKIFRYEIDPRVFVLDKEGRIVYAEKEGDERIMSPEFLLEKLK